MALLFKFFLCAHVPHVKGHLTGGERTRASSQQRGAFSASRPAREGPTLSAIFTQYSLEEQYTGYVGFLWGKKKKKKALKEF